MRKPWIPKLVLDLGDGERYEVKSLMASEIEAIARMTGDTVETRFELLGKVLGEDPRAWRALVHVMRKRAGRIEDYSAIDVDLDAAEAWCVDDDGREVHLKIEPQPCSVHRKFGIDPKCDRGCGADGPATGADDQIVWVYDDSGEPVPTRRSRRSGTGPSTSLTSSGTSTPSGPGTPAT